MHLLFPMVFAKSVTPNIKSLGRYPYNTMEVCLLLPYIFMYAAVQLLATTTSQWQLAKVIYE